MRTLARLTVSLTLALAAAPAFCRTTALPIPPSGVIGVQEAMFSPDYWIAKTPASDMVVLDRARVAAQNASLLKSDPSMHDLSTLGATVPGTQVHGWLGKLAAAMPTELYDAHDQPVPNNMRAAITDNAALERVSARVPVQFGLVVHRVSMRNHPTSLRAFPGKGLQDFESFQESTLFPGDPVAIVHTSRDGRWVLVVSPRYVAWVQRDAIAVGSREAVLAYAATPAYRVVTGDEVRTVYTPEAPAVSELQLDMGTRIPLAALPPEQPVNGQGPYVSWTLQLPTRAADGSLRLQPALLRRTADSAPDYLPLTRANILRQAFKFLGERYGWGHLYNGRDCSGFVSDVYRSMGVQMPRNTGDQAKSPVLPHRLFTAADGHAARMQAIAALQAGDLIYIPGHVMMFLGRVNGEPYVIHDVGGTVFHDAAGRKRWTKTNEVSVTPLLPLLVDDKLSYVDAMVSIVHFGT